MAVMIGEAGGIQLPSGAHLLNMSRPSDQAAMRPCAESSSEEICLPPLKLRPMSTTANNTVPTIDFHSSSSSRVAANRNHKLSPIMGLGNASRKSHKLVLCESKPMVHTARKRFLPRPAKRVLARRILEQEPSHSDD